MITFINKEVCRSNVIEKVHINFSGREFGMKRRRWRKRGEWRRCQLQLEATWDNFSECLWRMLGRLIRGIKSIQTKWHIDILVSVCKEGIRKGCYTDISLISSCSQEIHPCDNCCTTWAHLGSPTVGAWWFFFITKPFPQTTMVRTLELWTQSFWGSKPLQKDHGKLWIFSLETWLVSCNLHQTNGQDLRRQVFFQGRIFVRNSENDEPWKGYTPWN